MSDITPNKSFQPWKIDVVESLLHYAYKNKQARQIALTICLYYSTIKEWYYLVKGQQKFQVDDHEKGNENADPSCYQDEEGEWFSFHIASA